MRVRSPSPRGCAYSEHAFYSAGSASMHFTVRAARCAATGSRGKRHEQGGAHDVGWSALHTATGRLIRHISSSLPPITLPSNAHRRAYYPLMRSRGQLNSVLSEPGRCVRTCAIDRDRSSIPRLTSSSRAISINAQDSRLHAHPPACAPSPPVLPARPPGHWERRHRGRVVRPTRVYRCTVHTASLARAARAGPETAESQSARYSLSLGAPRLVRS